MEEFETSELVCPYCGDEVINIDMYDYEFIDAEVIGYYCGECIRCKNEVHFKEIYTFKMLIMQK